VNVTGRKRQIFSLDSTRVAADLLTSAELANLTLSLANPAGSE